MRSTDDHEHAWAQARLELHQARLLEPDADERLRAHAAACDACRDVLETPRAPDTESGAHVPASVLARWPGVSADLPALERELIEQHLRDCEPCREDLRVTTTPAAATPARPGLVRWERVWAIAATAAAASLAVMWWVAPRGPVREPAPASAPAEPSPMSPVPFTLAPSPVTLRDVTRGGGVPAAAVVEPGANEPVVVAFEPLDVPDDTPVAMELSTASGALQARTMHIQAELYPHRQLVVGDAGHPLADGDYVLRLIAWPGSARADTQSFALTVRRRH